MKAKGRFAAVLRERCWLAPSILEFRLQRPSGFDFIAGQFVRFFMEDCQREYTMTSGPGDETLTFCIAIENSGRFSDGIQHADIGALLHFDGPWGHFVYQGPANPAIFVATGTGVAPFVAFCRSGVRGALLLHGVGTPERLVYRQVLQTGVQSYVGCISRGAAEDKDDPVLFPGRVTRYLETRLASGTYDFYLCGRRGMIRTATAIIDRRFEGSRLFMEAYND